jgi:hypothetical protein
MYLTERYESVFLAKDILGWEERFLHWRLICHIRVVLLLFVKVSKRSFVPPFTIGGSTGGFCIQRSAARQEKRGGIANRSAVKKLVK